MIGSTSTPTLPPPLPWKRRMRTAIVIVVVVMAVMVNRTVHRHPRQSPLRRRDQSRTKMQRKTTTTMTKEEKHHRSYRPPHPRRCRNCRLGRPDLWQWRRPSKPGGRWRRQSRTMVGGRRAVMGSGAGLRIRSFGRREAMGSGARSSLRRWWLVRTAMQRVEMGVSKLVVSRLNRPKRRRRRAFGRRTATGSGGWCPRRRRRRRTLPKCLLPRPIRVSKRLQVRSSIGGNGATIAMPQTIPLPIVAVVATTTTTTTRRRRRRPRRRQRSRRSIQSRSKSAKSGTPRRRRRRRRLRWWSRHRLRLRRQDRRSSIRSMTTVARREATGGSCHLGGSSSTPAWKVCVRRVRSI
mmetsp:Transcript_7030/g.15565  ORF Transcript_7030/g.15565 Transcript_7030/m.15565 type:complete len:350 (-) Transcript_7030:860-1909(-)